MAAAASAPLSSSPPPPSAHPHHPKESFRALAPGSFAALTVGRTHYLLHGLENAQNGKPLIVCVHGINAEAPIYGKFAAFFVARGRTVLTFDLYGRGYSDGTDKRHDLDLFVGQLNDLLSAPDVTARVRTAVVDLVGSSLGGAIVAGFSSRFPDRVRRCVMMAPAGLGLPVFGKVAQSIFKVEFLGRALLNLANNGRGLDKNMLQSFGNPTHPDVLEHVRLNVERVKTISENHPGYVPGFVSTVAHFPLASMQDDYRKLGASKVQCLLVWGDKDTVVDFARDSPTARSLLPHAELYVIEGGGHIDHFVIQPYIDMLHTKVAEFLDL